MENDTERDAGIPGNTLEDRLQRGDSTRRSAEGDDGAGPMHDPIVTRLATRALETLGHPLG